MRLAWERAGRQQDEQAGQRADGEITGQFSFKAGFAA